MIDHKESCDAGLNSRVKAAGWKEDGKCSQGLVTRITSVGVFALDKAELVDTVKISSQSYANSSDEKAWIQE